jgi:hypothetical protein
VRATSPMFMSATSCRSSWTAGRPLEKRLGIESGETSNSAVVFLLLRKNYVGLDEILIVASSPRNASYELQEVEVCRVLLDPQYMNIYLTSVPVSLLDTFLHLKTKSFEFYYGDI